MSGLTPTGFVAATTTSIQKAIETDELALIDPGLNLGVTQPLGQMNGIFAASQANVWALVQAVYAAIDPNGAVGVQLDNICALTGVTRLPATKTLVTCTVNLNAGTYAPGALTANIVGYPQYTFVNRDQVVSPGGALTGIVFISTQTGPIAANSGTLSVITFAVGGWNSITNPANGTTGTNVETDTALRLRRATLLTLPGGGTADSMRAALLAIPNVLQASVLENPTGDPGLQGQAPWSFQAIIWDNALADNTKIAQAIWNVKPSGVRTFGSVTANATDASGRTQPVSFTRVQAIPIYFAVTVKVNPNVFPTNGVALIQAAFVALGATQVPGSSSFSVYTSNGPGNVYATEYMAAALSVPGVVDVPLLALDFAPSPVATVNIGMDYFHIATVAAVNVAVTVT